MQCVHDVQHRPLLFSSQPGGLPFVFPQTELFLRLHSVILQHPTIFPHILALDFQARLWLNRFDHEMIVTEGAILVAVFKLLHVLPKALLALLAGKSHLRRLLELVILGFGVAYCAIKPLPAAGGADGDLGVEDVFAEDTMWFSTMFWNEKMIKVCHYSPHLGSKLPGVLILAQRVRPGDIMSSPWSEQF